MIQRDLVEQGAHIIQRRDRHTDLAHLSQRQRLVAVIADLGGEIKRHREAGLTVLKQVAVARVALGGRGVARVLAHRPQAPAVHRRLHTPGEGILTGEAQAVRVIDLFWQVQPLQLHPRAGLKSLLSFRETFQYRREGLLFPARLLCLHVVVHLASRSRSCNRATASRNRH
jgi:hypothetical protein